MAVRKKTVVDSIPSRLLSIESKLDAFEELDFKLQEAVEARVSELRAVSYVTLLLVAIIAAMALGYLLKNWGF